MVRFFIYLFESGLCLSLFYLGYIVFFRRETYFTYNRIYLMGSMLLSLLLPVLPITWPLDSIQYLSGTAQNVSDFRNYYEQLIFFTDPSFGGEIANSVSSVTSSEVISSAGAFSWVNLLMIIYIVGIAYFLARFAYLFWHLTTMLRQGQKHHFGDVIIVHINDEVPPFSFMKWIFLNPSILTEHDLQQVLTHEKVHVKHKHSLDLLVAQIIGIFLWFNPLTWRIQKSIKTIHEYIADRAVISQGHGLFDYQSLLLSQLISIRSVELVNNFNVLSIKKRIAMMNKQKSGRWAYFKVLLVMPILFVAFFFFANMTPTEIIQQETVVNEPVEGHFVPNKEDKMLVKGQHVSLPKITQAKAFEKDKILTSISITSKSLWVDGKQIELSELTHKLNQLKASKEVKEDTKMTVILAVSKEVPMNQVDAVRAVLRQVQLLKVGYLANAGSASQALFQLLPPMDAKLLDVTMLGADKVQLIDIKSPGDRVKLKKHLVDNERYVMRYQYNSNGLFEDYIQTIDMVYSIIHDFRDELAKSEGTSFDEMSWDKQEPIRKRYPITLTQEAL